MLEDFARVWEKGGKVRLVIGFHERFDIAPALRTDLDIRSAIRDAVTNAILGYTDELRKLLTEKKSIIPALREMINQRGLYVRLVTPRVIYDQYLKKGKWPEYESGTFHSKFMIFHFQDNDRDRYGLMRHVRRLLRRLNRDYYESSRAKVTKGSRFTVVTTSMNESTRGYTENIEDAVLHRSWIENEQEVSMYFLDRFNDLWVDNCSDVVTMPFTDKIAEVLRDIEESEKSKRFGWVDFVKALGQSPVYHGLAFPKVGLLPHQISVYSHALNRWPIRILLGDEVGLGKTIEAGSIISYLINHCGVRKILILTPASLRKQWQSELSELFGYEFWVYNSTTQTCENGLEEKQVGEIPLNNDAEIDRIIVSWHWARLRSADHLFDENDPPDLVIVDEAHHARIHDDGKRQYSTKLHSLLMELQNIVPHFVMLTATPFQTDILDYFSLLQILGVPEGFRKKLEEYSRWALGQRLNRLATWVVLLKEIHQYMLTYNLASNSPMLSRLDGVTIQESIFYENLVNEFKGLPHEYVIAFHPATFMAARNYRSSLKTIGYHFPVPHIDSPFIKISPTQAAVLENIEEYIRDYLGLPEKAISSVGNLGLMRSLYRQRVVSSINAAFDTLNRRRMKLDRFIKSDKITDLKPDSVDDISSSDHEEEDQQVSTISSSQTDNVHSSVRENALTEIYTVDKILGDLSQFVDGEMIIDPKMIRLKEIVREHTSVGRKVLVFSRFTSTTEAVIKALREFADSVGLGRFDGTFVGMYEMSADDLMARESTRTEVVRSLKRGEIQILVCSDAASEGLNLHSANVVINVDVPWNPSRLLQRFGRVDRLGQRADDVYLVNLYYPNSIEQRMYEVLEDRRTDFRAVLGEVPEIMSEAQKRFITALGSEQDVVLNVTLEEIQEKRSQYLQGKIVGKSVSDKGTIQAKGLYESLVQTLAKMADDANLVHSIEEDRTIDIDSTRISLDPLDDQFEGFHNPHLIEFEKIDGENKLDTNIHMLTSDNGTPLCIAIVIDDYVIPILSKDWHMYFDFCFRGLPFDTSNMARFHTSEFDNLLAHLKAKEGWIWPDHETLQCLSKVQPEFPQHSNIVIGGELGKISII